MPRQGRNPVNTIGTPSPDPRPRSNTRPATTALAAGSQALLRDLPHAARRGELRAFFQPKLDTATGQLVGAEALARWQHPRFGLLLPDTFIPLAERSGHIESIGHWMVDEVCRQLAAWDAEGLPTPEVAVNVSLRELRNADLLPQIGHCLRRHGIGPHRLLLEFTESTAMHDPQYIADVLARLRTAGLRVALDDFGTGHSSLARLHALAAHELKLDRSFVTPLDAQEPKTCAIVAAVVALARALDMQVVAEGVETPAQLEILRKLGCRQVQGFLFSQPLPAAAFASGWLH